MKNAPWAGVLLLLPTTTFASDWKYAGYQSQTALAPVPSISFFDADSLKREGRIVRVWVKSIPQKTLDNFAGPRGKKKFNEFVDAAAAKIASGYVPPLLTVPSLREKLQGDFKEFLAEIVAWEVAANKGATHTSRFLFEIDCGQKAI